jgi:hypothetical protein
MRPSSTLGTIVLVVLGHPSAILLVLKLLAGIILCQLIDQHVYFGLELAVYPGWGCDVLLDQMGRYCEIVS